MTFDLTKVAFKIKCETRKPLYQNMTSLVCTQNAFIEISHSNHVYFLDYKFLERKQKAKNSILYMYRDQVIQNRIAR